jgi:Family of unknown function (DUF6058)
MQVEASRAHPVSMQSLPASSFPVACAITPLDLHYVRSHYQTLESIAQQRGEHVDELARWVGEALPGPTYELADGSRWFAPDWGRLYDDAGAAPRIATLFERRLCAAAAALGEPVAFAAAWSAYLRGLYGACLREVTPETIVAKARLVRRIDAAIARPALSDPAWRAELRDDVGALDGLLRSFAECDRVRFGRPTSRDRYVDEVRRRYPQLFAW